jgi:uncharacterized protein
MTTIGLLSDTHGFLPPAVFTHFDSVDEIWHAGDIGTQDVSEQLKSFKPLRAVYGNIDGGLLRVEFKEVEFFQIEEVPVLMMHIGGYPPKYNLQSKPLIEKHKPHLFICGHSHILKIILDPKYNLLHINPGACGKQGWHKVSTLIRLQIDGHRLVDLQIIELKK